jgi:hypothetical protein
MPLKVISFIDELNPQHYSPIHTVTPIPKIPPHCGLIVQAIGA